MYNYVIANSHIIIYKLYKVHNVWVFATGNRLHCEESKIILILLLQPLLYMYKKNKNKNQIIIYLFFDGRKLLIVIFKNYYLH